MANGVPEDVREHLMRLIASSDDEWAKADGALARLEAVWSKKDRLFREQVALLDMEEADGVAAGDGRGMLLLTYSGSLVSLGCGAKRWLEYASIKLRSDVPDVVRCEGAALAGDIRIGGAAEFTGAPLKKTSALHRIVACPAGLSEAEQEKRVREATVFLTNSFVHVNRDLTAPGGEGPDQFDRKAMTAYLAGRSGLTQKAVRELLDDYHVILETGLLMGRPVPVGRIGRLQLASKPARKARVGRNPATGEEITIPAREARMAPAFKFSARTKQRAAALAVPESAEEE